jgi:hypothetical protein
MGTGGQEENSIGIVIVVIFPQAPFRMTNVPGHVSAGIIQLRNCTLAS